MNDLITIEPSNIQTVFTAERGLDPYLETIANEARSLVADASTAKGRDAIRSMAAKVARSKTALDDMGKKLVADMKKMPTMVDNERKRMREFLDALKEEVRAPLTEYEAEQERIKAAKAAEEAAKALAAQIETDWEMAILMDREVERQKEEAERLRAEQKRIREEQIRKQAEEDAQRRAQEREVELRLQAERAAEATRLAEARAAQALKDAEENAKLIAAQKIEEERRKVKEAEARAARAVEEERIRVKAEEERKAQEEAARAADVEHRRKVNQEILADMQAFCDLDEETAKSVINAVASGLITNMVITY